MTRSHKSYQWILLLFFFSTFFYFVAVPDSDNDLLGHLLFGKIIDTQGIPLTDTLSYTAYGKPWLNHEWLSEFLGWKLHEYLGLGGLFTYKFLFCTVLVAIFFIHSVSNGVSLGVASLCGAICIAALARGIAIRPQLISFLFFGLTLVTLRNWSQGKRKTPWILIPIFCIWANSHGGFVLGLGAIGIFAAFQFLYRTSLRIHAALILIFSFLVCFINPYGIGVFQYVLDETTRDHPITEWAPVSIFEGTHVPFLLLVFVYLACLIRRVKNKESHWRVVLTLIVLFFAFRHQRHVPMFVIAAWIEVSEGVNLWWNSYKEKFLASISSISLQLIAVAVIGISLFQCFKAVVAIRMHGVSYYNPLEYPLGVVSYLKDKKCTANIATPLEWGSYILWHLSDYSKVSLDGRFAIVYPQEIVDLNFQFFEGAPGGEKLLSQYSTDAIIAPLGLNMPFLKNDEWKKVRSDEASDLYVKVENPCF